MENQCKNEDLVTFVKQMPKIELHAHLNGSLTHSTLHKLIKLKEGNQSTNFLADYDVLSATSKDISKCFELFELIHRFTDSPEAIYLATQEVIKDFYDDNVQYLELRTTPKEIPSVMSQDMYVQTVLKAIQDVRTLACQGMTVKLLLSLDRKRSIQHTEETLKVAEKYYHESNDVVGLDLSGNPTSGDMKDFIPFLECAKKSGMKLAVHISEIPGAFEEINHMLNLLPDRLGHGTYLHVLKGGSQSNFNRLMDLQIPLEICLTSNVITKTVPSYDEHHFKLFREMNYPCVLCTDDKGLFKTTLTNEYLLASKHFGLSKEELHNLSCSSINYIFSDEMQKAELAKHFKTYM